MGKTVYKKSTKSLQKVYKNSSGGGSRGGMWRGPLLPQLAGLPELQHLEFESHSSQYWARIPRQWTVPGAFPRLKE